MSKQPKIFKLAKAIEHNSSYGWDPVFTHIAIAEYHTPNNIAVILLTDSLQDYDGATITVNIRPLPENQNTMDINSDVVKDTLLPLLDQQGVITPIFPNDDDTQDPVHINSGFLSYPLYQVNLDVIEKLERVEV